MRRFRPFIESVEAIQRLDEVITWLPVDELSVNLEYFRDAVVRRPASDDPIDTNDSLTARFAHGSFVIPQRDALSRVSDSNPTRLKMANEASHLQRQSNS